VSTAVRESSGAVRESGGAIREHHAAKRTVSVYKCGVAGMRYLCTITEHFFRQMDTYGISF
jgi:predicted HD phosphohydrolase